MEIATRKPGVAVLSANTFNDVLSASLLRFQEMVKRLQDLEHDLAFKMPFLNLMHDLWKVRTGKNDVIGTSIAFIDKDWTFRNIALLLTVFNESHESDVVQGIIASRFNEIYNVEIGSMSRFVMSDMSPAAQKVSKLFEDSVPVDCSMHMLNLCLVYGLGMRENVKTITEVDPATKQKTKYREFCTPGGPFRKAQS